MGDTGPHNKQCMLLSTPVGTRLVPRTLFLYIPAAHGFSYVPPLLSPTSTTIIRGTLDGLSEQGLSWERPLQLP